MFIEMDHIFYSKLYGGSWVRKVYIPSNRAKSSERDSRGRRTRAAHGVSASAYIYAQKLHKHTLATRHSLDRLINLNLIINSFSTVFTKGFLNHKKKYLGYCTEKRKTIFVRSFLSLIKPRVSFWMAALALLI